MKLVIVESPYKGNLFQRWLNKRYARKCILDCLLRGESPLASHLLYTQVLNDQIPEERKIGIESGLAWVAHADVMAIYIDRGISGGMCSAELRANRLGIPVEHRSLDKRPSMG